MKINLNDYKNDLLFLPLGGTQEIGANCYLYHYKGKWIVVDLGVGFADDHFPGIELLVPDINFLSANKKNILGIVLTHAHEDHIGAVQYLWNELRLPIYTTRFTATVLKTKLAEMGLMNEVPIHEIAENGSFEIGPFNLEFIGLTHSIPEMQGLYIKTEQGNLFHTGDWKLDPDPVLGQLTNEKRLKEIGEEGVLAMVCDSTNIFNSGSSGSEGHLKHSLTELIESFKNNLAIFTTFASNLARVHSIITAAQKAGKKVILAGTSLWRMVECAKECGYLDDINEVYRTRDINRFPRKDVIVIATGCQGEPLAAISKLAKEEHPDFKLQKDDIVVFASRIIPGNESKIFRLFNKLCRLGAHIISEKDHFVHVSGHPAKEEVARMYGMVKPQIAIPMHGEPMHIHEHCQFAKSLGVKQTFAVEDGKLLKISANNTEFIDSIPITKMAIDGNFIIPTDSEVLKMRRKMRDSGLIVLNVIINSKGKLLKNPTVLAPGVLDSKEDWQIFDLIIQDVRDFLDMQKRLSDSDMDIKLRTIVKRIIKAEVGKDPRILITVNRIPT